MEFVLAAMVLVAIVVFFVTVPLRRAADEERVVEDRRAALDAAKEAKYREIRDVELDHRMGKLSESDWKEADAELRTQAIEILRELDRLGVRADPPEAAASPSEAAADPPEAAASNGS